MIIITLLRSGETITMECPVTRDASREHMMKGVMEWLSMTIAMGM